MKTNKPIMKKATAMWLIDNTALSFKQIAEFCDLHELEIQGMADGEVCAGIAGQNPINNCQLTKEMIAECEKDSLKKLELKEELANDIIINTKSRKNNTYVPVARRESKPNGIAYLVKFYPEISDKQVRKLVSTTTPMIKSIRERTHWNIKEIEPKDPVLLGLCSQSQFNEVVDEIGKEAAAVDKKIVKKPVKKAAKTTKQIEEE